MGAELNACHYLFVCIYAHTEEVKTYFKPGEAMGHTVEFLLEKYFFLLKNPIQIRGFFKL